MRPLTKAVYRIESYDEVVDTIYRAYRTAVEGEPGPVYVELPANLQLLSAEVGELPAWNKRDSSLSSAVPGACSNFCASLANSYR